MPRTGNPYPATSYLASVATVDLRKARVDALRTWTDGGPGSSDFADVVAAIETILVARGVVCGECREDLDGGGHAPECFTGMEIQLEEAS